MAEPSVLIIANPTAGTTSGELLSEVAELCRSGSPHVRLHHTSGRGDAARVVCRARAGTDGQPAPALVVAVGGDGTVREVVEGLTDRTAPGPVPALFIVPAGTGNSGYLMLWGTRPWQEALRSVLGWTANGAARSRRASAGGDGPAGESTDGPDGEAELRRLDLALLVETGLKVVLGACSGVIAEALRTARGIPQTGRERYALAFARTAEAFVPYPGRVTVDGRVLHEGPTVLANVGGGRHRGGQYLVLPRSQLDDGLLDVCVIGGDIPPARVPELTRHADHLGMPGVAYGRGRRIVVERLDGRPLCFEHDGELQPRATSSMTLQVLPGSLPVWGASTRRIAYV